MNNEWKLDNIYTIIPDHLRSFIKGTSIQLNQNVQDSFTGEPVPLEATLPNLVSIGCYISEATIPSISPGNGFGKFQLKKTLNCFSGLLSITLYLPYPCYNTEAYPLLLTAKTVLKLRKICFTASAIALWLGEFGNTWVSLKALFYSNMMFTSGSNRELLGRITPFLLPVCGGFGNPGMPNVSKRSPFLSLASSYRL